MMLPKIKEAIIVEGKYDKIKLMSIVDAVVIETSGFHIFKDPQQMRLIRQMAEKNGIIILTDSDGAGFLIRNFLTGIVDPSKIKQAYIPDLFGKERRKTAPSKEGKLGVEGVPKQVVLEALQRCGATFSEESPEDREKKAVTKTDFFTLGFTGGEYSAARRACLLRKLSLPERMATNALLRVINDTMTREEFLELAEQCTCNLDDQENF